MANTYLKLPLSESTNGKRILITATKSSSATPIHTAVAGEEALDEIWLYAYNDSTASLACSILWGGTDEPNDVDRTNIPPRGGRVLIEDGRLLQNGLTVSAYVSSSNNSISIDGFVNRIIPS